MRLMSALPFVTILLPLGKCWTSSFSGARLVQRQQRSYARQSPIRMMPEGPEVRTVVDQLKEGGIGRRLVDIQFLSGRYVRHGRPNGFAEFARTMTPAFHPHQSVPESPVDIIKEWNAKGKFIYIVLDGQRKLNDNEESSSVEIDDADFQRSIWITLGMTGQFVSEKIHEKDPKYARWYLELMDVESGATSKIYYHDQRNFGALKFSLSQAELVEKLKTLGPDILDPNTTIDDFLLVAASQRPVLNICKFLMDQSKIAGVGNYILAECLYRANIDPFASLEELNEAMLRELFAEIQAVANESYTSMGLTRQYVGTFRNVDGERGKFEFQLQCYGRERCAKGNLVIKDTQGPHGRTIWFTKEQLFMPRRERYKRKMAVDPKKKESTTSSQDASLTPPTEDTATGINSGNEELSLLSGLQEKGWKSALSHAIDSESFHRLEQFLQDERAAGATIYPPPSDIFSAFNLCPFEKVKVVIVGQDPYHGPGQGHGLAFSVRRGVTPPPSLRNIFVEAVNDVGIDAPAHGNLEHWAQQGVLLLNTVLTVRRGEANSHSKQGWEAFTDEVIRAVNEKSNGGLVVLLWGNPAQQKAKSIDESKHVVIRTSHPSPLGATKTKSPFLGSRCFSRANEALRELGKEPIDWSV